MKCAACGGAELIHDTRDLQFTYKGETTTVEGISADYCPACAEVFMGPDASRQYDEAIQEFIREVNASYVEPDYIRRVRNKLRLDQKEAALIFGGGVNAFSRYEKGRIKPSLSTVKLLKFLDRHPEYLEEIRSA